MSISDQSSSVLTLSKQREVMMGKKTDFLITPVVLDAEDLREEALKSR